MASSDHMSDDYPGILSQVGLACVGFAMITNSLEREESDIDDGDIYEWHDNAAHLLLAADRVLVPSGDEQPFLDLAIELVTALRIFYYWSDRYLRGETDGEENLDELDELLGDSAPLNSEQFGSAMRFAWRLAPEADWGQLFLSDD